MSQGAQNGADSGRCPLVQHRQVCQKGTANEMKNLLNSQESACGGVRAEGEDEAGWMFQGLPALYFKSSRENFTSPPPVPPLTMPKRSSSAPCALFCRNQRGSAST